MKTSIAKVVAISFLYVTAHRWIAGDVPNYRKFALKLTHPFDLPMWPNGQRTQMPCAVERYALSGRGSRLRPGASAYQRIISNNSYAYDEQGVNPGHVGGFDGVLYKL